jgi:hypothetical protein
MIIFTRNFNYDALGIEGLASQPPTPLSPLKERFNHDTTTIWAKY